MELQIVVQAQVEGANVMQCRKCGQDDIMMLPVLAMDL
jgi:hypothetical protein